MPEHVHDKFCHGLDCIDEEPGPTVDELLAALLDTLSVEDLKAAAAETRFAHDDCNPKACQAFALATRLDRAADALAALKETQP